MSFLLILGSMYEFEFTLDWNYEFELQACFEIVMCNFHETIALESTNCILLNGYKINILVFISTIFVTIILKSVCQISSIKDL